MATTNGTETDKKELVERLNREVYREGNLDLIDEIYAEDYVEHNPALPHEIRGREAVREKIAMFQTAFSEATGTTEDIVAEGDRVADRHRFRAIHDGEFMEIEATGNEIDIEGMAIHRFEDGKIVETWVQADMMGLMNQLGVQ